MLCRLSNRERQTSSLTEEQVKKKSGFFLKNNFHCFVTSIQKIFNTVVNIKKKPKKQNNVAYSSFLLEKTLSVSTSRSFSQQIVVKRFLKNPILTRPPVHVIFQFYLIRRLENVLEWILCYKCYKDEFSFFNLFKKCKKIKLRYFRMFSQVLACPRIA